MPYANNNGVKIYYEVEGQGPPLVLAHGLTRDLSRWRTLGYADALKDDFRLVMFDARGHGRSDKLHDPLAYGLHMVEDIMSVMDNVGFERAHFFGYSMGAIIAFRFAFAHQDRLLSCILGGGSPYLGEADIGLQREVMAEAKLLLVDPEGSLRQRELKLGRSLTSTEKNTLMANDAEALVAAWTSVMDLPPLSDRNLSTISKSCLVYCGERDPFHAGARESVKHMPDAEFVSLPGLDHGAAAVRSDIVLPHIKEFLAKVSKR